jgi:hypothetical protein
VAAEVAAEVMEHFGCGSGLKKNDSYQGIALAMPANGVNADGFSR